MKANEGRLQRLLPREFLRESSQDCERLVLVLGRLGSEVYAKW